MDSTEPFEPQRETPHGSTHADAIAHYRSASQRPGTTEGGGTRNRACPHCSGVVPFDSTHCPHCSRPMPGQRFDYFNYSDFEPNLEAREDRLIRRVCALALASIALLILWQCIL